jgi:hypothetical protein
LSKILENSNEYEWKIAMKKEQKYERKIGRETCDIICKHELTTVTGNKFLQVRFEMLYCATNVQLAHFPRQGGFD